MIARPVAHNAFRNFLGVEYSILLAGMGVGGRATPRQFGTSISRTRAAAFVPLDLDRFGARSAVV